MTTALVKPWLDSDKSRMSRLRFLSSKYDFKLIPMLGLGILLFVLTVTSSLQRASAQTVPFSSWKNVAASGGACSPTNLFGATGGTITDVGGYRIHTFTSSGNFVTSTCGPADYLVVGGGGGGGSYHIPSGAYSPQSDTGAGGGGGGGGVLQGANYSVASTGNYPITVGAGGTANGGASRFDSIIAGGGGCGGTYHTVGCSGANGGGGGGDSAGIAGGASTGGGFAGGTGGVPTGIQGGGGGGGGGGAGMVGGNGQDGSGYGGTGGDGVSSTIRGVTEYFGGGGGGGMFTNLSTVPGGLGGGGAGGSTGQYGFIAGSAGAANTGGGGGGGGGYSGGSGIVVIRYQIPVATLSYGVSSLLLNVGYAASYPVPVVTSGAVVSVYSISPSLPAGLSFNLSTGLISGVPSAASPATDYTITASNAAGSASTILNITVLAAPPVSNLEASTGGTITVVNGFRVHTITANDSFIPSSSTGTLTYMIVGGGGGGGAGINGSGGGGGGQIKTGTMGVTNGVAIPVVIGAGGSPGGDGALSSLGAVSAAAGLKGLDYLSGIDGNGGAAGGGLTGGVGAAANRKQLSSSPAQYTSGYGGGGGGGGATSAGMNGGQAPNLNNYWAPQKHAGQGGNGYLSSISGTSVYYGSGGGGNGNNSGVVVAGLSSNGQGNSTATSQGAVAGLTSAAANTGGGGGGGAYGGSGVVFVSYPLSVQSLTYPRTVLNLSQNFAIVPISPATTGGAPTAYSVAPALPTGLSLDPVTGVISGTPTVLSSASNYTVTAANSTGGSQIVFTIAVVTSAPSALTSTITGSGPVSADGVSTSVITITLLDGAGLPVPYFIPSFSASNAGSTNTYGLCSLSDLSGVSTCTLTSLIAESKILTLQYPTVVAGGTVVFVSSGGLITNSTGGTITTSGEYQIHTFTSGGTFVAAGGGMIDYLVVGGGGGGGTETNSYWLTSGWPYVGVSSGGDAGKMVQGSKYAAANDTYAVTVGAGGLPKASGSSSQLGAISAAGGAANTLVCLFSSGSGGGASGPSVPCTTYDYTYRSGVDGLASSISGALTYYAGGGGGSGAFSGPPGGLGGGGVGYGNGLSAGGWGPPPFGVGIDGTPNTGGGGGGGGMYGTSVYQGGVGGSGIVIVRYQLGVSTLSYPVSNITLYKDFGMAPISPATTGGTPTPPYTIYPALPAGLSINSTTGVISGTPTVLSSPTNYTVTAANSNGASNFVVNIGVTSSGAPSATNSTIAGTSPIIADGGTGSVVTIILKNSSNAAVAGVIPYFTATDTSGGNTYGACSVSDASGVSTCSLMSSVVESKTLTISGLGKTGGPVVFTAPAALAIAPTTSVGVPQAVAPGNTLLITRSPGIVFTVSGGVLPYTYSETHADSVHYGSIAANGIYTAPAGYPGFGYAPHITITDLKGSVVHAYLAIVPSLWMSPSFGEVAVNSSASFVAMDGVPPYTYAVTTGTGTVSSSGLFTAPAGPGAGAVRATDLLSNTATATTPVVLTVLSMPPTTSNISATTSYLLTASGGLGPYTFVLNSGTGTLTTSTSVTGNVNDTTAVYTAGAASSSGVVKVTDAWGASATATFTAATIDQAPSCPNGSKTFTTGNAANTGTSTTWTVPAGITSAVVKVWGAGGGGGGGDFGNNWSGGAGGGGGFSQATITTVPAESLTIKIGGGGLGAASAPSSSAGSGGGGGDYSAVLRGSTFLVAAGGGGGGGGSSNNGTAGGYAGQPGSATYVTSAYTQSASMLVVGGVGTGSPGVGNVGGNGAAVTAGVLGGTLSGGRGGISDTTHGGGGGGGGGGYFAGGGGDPITANIVYSGESGGGGSGVVSGTNTIAWPGSGANSGGASDPNWATTVTATSVALTKTVTLSAAQAMSPGLTVAGGTIPASDKINTVTSTTVFALKTAPSSAGSNVVLTITGYGTGGAGGTAAGTAGVSGKVYICY